jgi:hypothetical protein
MCNEERRPPAAKNAASPLQRGTNVEQKLQATPARSWPLWARAKASKLSRTQKSFDGIQRRARFPSPQRGRLLLGRYLRRANREVKVLLISIHWEPAPRRNSSVSEHGGTFLPRQIPLQTRRYCWRGRSEKIAA